MMTLKSLLAACALAFTVPFAALAAAPDVPEIAPAAAKGGCEKCKQGGMDMAGMGKMAHGAMEGMACCKGKQGGMSGMAGKGCCMGGMGHGDTAALERRIAELEKRLDLMQHLLTRPHAR